MALPWWPAPHFVETETWEDAGSLLSSLHHSLAIRTKVTALTAANVHTSKKRATKAMITRKQRIITHLHSQLCVYYRSHRFPPPYDYSGMLKRGLILKRSPCGASTADFMRTDVCTGADKINCVTRESISTVNKAPRTAGGNNLLPQLSSLLRNTRPS